MDADAALRAAVLVSVAETETRHHVGLDRRVAEHRAAAIRAGASSLALPPDLVEARREKSEAETSLAEVKAVHVVLINDATVAASAAKTALAAVGVAAVGVDATVPLSLSAREIAP